MYLLRPNFICGYKHTFWKFELAMRVPYAISFGVTFFKPSYIKFSKVIGEKICGHISDILEILKLSKCDRKWYNYL
jgi:hypothetical protein